MIFAILISICQLTQYQPPTVQYSPAVRELLGRCDKQLPIGSIEARLSLSYLPQIVVANEHWFTNVASHNIW